MSGTRTHPMGYLHACGMDAHLIGWLVLIDGWNIKLIPFPWRFQTSFPWIPIFQPPYLRIVSIGAGIICHSSVLTTALGTE
jgi:hypothetical protein